MSLEDFQVLKFLYCEENARFLGSYCKSSIIYSMSNLNS